MSHHDYSHYCSCPECQRYERQEWMDTALCTVGAFLFMCIVWAWMVL